MEITEKDSGKAAKEQTDLKRRLAEEKERADYLKGLKKDSSFRKFVIEGIIRKRIGELNNLDGITLKNLDFETLGKMTMVNKMVKKEVEDMFEELL